MSTMSGSRRVLRVAQAHSSGTEARRLDANARGEVCYGTVQDAIDAVPLGNTIRTTIVIPPGVYSQPIYIPKTKNFITLAGSVPELTVLTWDNTATNIRHHQVRGLPITIFIYNNVYVFYLFLLFSSLLV